MVSSQLIPGLPNDIAFQCLLCLSAKELLRVQKVSPLWRIVIQSDRFYVERRRRRPYPSVCVIRHMPHCYQCLDADLADLHNPRLLFSCENREGEKLFPPGAVFASVEASVYSFAPGHHAHKFSLLTRGWSQVSKLFPRGCKLMASTVGSHVVVIACNNQNSYDGDHGSDGEEFSGTVCEILDTHTNEWACTEGLPDLFDGTYCISHQGTVFAKGETIDGSPAVYGLNLTKRRWAEDAHMSAMLCRVPDEGKIIIDSTAVLLAKGLPDMVVLRHLSEDGKSMDVVSLAVSLSGDFFLFRQEKQLFLVVPSRASTWQTKSVFYYHQLEILHIPGELLMVDAIAG